MKIFRKAGTMLIAAVMCLSSFFAESVYAQKSDKELIFEYVTAFTSNTTFTPSEDGLYKIYCVGKSGNGYTPTDYNAGGGGGSGGIAVSNLILSAKESYPVTVTASKSGFGSNGFYATAGESSTGTSGGTGGRAYGGNIANDGGYRGGYGGSGLSINLI